MKFKGLNNTDKIINFNMCTNIKKSCHDDSFASIVEPDGSCHRLTSDDMDDSDAEFIDKKNPEAGMRILFDSKEKCNDTDWYTFTFDIKCDDDVYTSFP